eukprot:1478184-Pleurochrysis_carterae.AAC.1
MRVEVDKKPDVSNVVHAAVGGKRGRGTVGDGAARQTELSECVAESAGVLEEDTASLKHGPNIERGRREAHVLNDFIPLATVHRCRRS